MTEYEKILLDIIKSLCVSALGKPGYNYFVDMGKISNVLSMSSIGNKITVGEMWSILHSLESKNKIIMSIYSVYAGNQEVELRGYRFIND